MKKILYIISLILFLVSMILGYGCQEEKQDSLGSIYGMISVAGTAEPMRGTGVSLHYISSNGKIGALLLRTVTAIDGSFEFCDVKAGEYILRVEVPNYELTEYKVVVEKGRTARADIQIKPKNTYMVVRTLDPEITGTSVKFKADYSTQNNAYAYEIGFYYAQSASMQNSTFVKGHITESLKENYLFEAEISNLEKGAYYTQAYAENSYGRSYGDVRSFIVNGIPGANSFVVLEDIGLMVQKIDLGVATWSAAKEACENSNLGGFTDWRLPSLPELQYICQRHNDIGNFDDGSSYSRYWSSNPVAFSADNYYSVTFDGCWENAEHRAMEHRVRAVRTITE